MGHTNTSIVGEARVQPVAGDVVAPAVVRWMTNHGIIAVSHPDPTSLVVSYCITKEPGIVTIQQIDAIVLAISDIVVVDDGSGAAVSHPDSFIVTISHSISEDPRTSAGVHVNALIAGVPHNVVIDERARTVFQLNSLSAAISHSIIQDPGPTAVVHVDSLIVSISDRVERDGGARTVLHEDAFIVGSGVHNVVSYADIVATASHPDAMIVTVCDPVPEDPRIITVVHVDALVTSTPNNIVIDESRGIRRVPPTVFHVDALVAAICHSITKDPVLAAGKRAGRDARHAPHVDSLSGSISDPVVRDEVGPAVLQENAFVVGSCIHRVVIDGDPVAVSYTDPVVVTICDRVSENLRIIAVLHVDSLASAISDRVVCDVSIT